MMHWTKKSEREVARRYRVQRQPGSGNRPGPDCKDDHRLRGHVRIEQKDRVSDRHVIKSKDLARLKGRADRAGELAVFLVRHRSGELVMLTGPDLREMAELAGLGVEIVAHHHVNVSRSEQIPDLLTQTAIRDPQVIRAIEYQTPTSTWICLSETWFIPLVETSPWYWDQT